jgi:hypothetical protein
MQNENDYVMGRLQWLNHLSLVFNLTANCPLLSPSSSSVTTEAFLNKLIENFSHLSLEPKSSYNEKSSIKSLSFKDLFTLFEDDFGQILTWDRIMEKVVFFEVQSKKHRRGGSSSPGSIDLNELVFISRLSSSVDLEAEPRSARLGDLRIPQTPPSVDSGSFIAISGDYTPKVQESMDFSVKTSLRVPEISSDLISMMKKQSQVVQKLNLSCKKLAVVSQNLPNTLIQLDISHNHLEKMPCLQHLERLELLNLSWNFLTHLTGEGPRALKELYLAHNRLENVEAVDFYNNLIILDVSFNKIQNFSALSSCSTLEDLQVLDVEGNPLTTVTGWKERLSNQFPTIACFDNKSLSKFSKFPRRSGTKMKVQTSSNKNLRSKSKK